MDVNTHRGAEYPYSGSLLVKNKMRIFEGMKILFEAVQVELRHFRKWEEWISIFFKTGEYIWLLPLRWDDLSKSLKISRKVSQILICALGILYNIARGVYSIYVMATVNFAEVGRDELVALLIDGISRGFGILVFVWQLKNMGGSVNMLNEVYGLHKKYKGA